MTTDIDNFWTAYDKVITTKDRSEQLSYLNKLFIEKGTQGLRAMMQARGYTPEEYIDAINNRREYWTSIRPNTLRAGEFGDDIELGSKNSARSTRNYGPPIFTLPSVFSEAAERPAAAIF